MSCNNSRRFYDLITIYSTRILYWLGGGVVKIAGKKTYFFCKEQQFSQTKVLEPKSKSLVSRG
jgi:hypothetical protein